MQYGNDVARDCKENSAVEGEAYYDSPSKCYITTENSENFAIHTVAQLEKSGRIFSNIVVQLKEPITFAVQNTIQPKRILKLVQYAL